MDTRIIDCERCGGEDHHCPVCDGRGEIEIETSPITMEDLDAEA